jgi:hypothetical protein
MKDCRIYHAQICIRCEKVEETKRGGLQGFYCSDCYNTMKEKFEHWKEHGLYLQPKD